MFMFKMVKWALLTQTSAREKSALRVRVTVIAIMNALETLGVGKITAKTSIQRLNLILTAVLKRVGYYLRQFIDSYIY